MLAVAGPRRVRQRGARKYIIVVSIVAPVRERETVGTGARRFAILHTKHTELVLTPTQQLERTLDNAPT